MNVHEKYSSLHEIEIELTGQRRIFTRTVRSLIVRWKGGSVGLALQRAGGERGWTGRFVVLECEFGHPVVAAEGLRGGGGPRPSRKFRRPPRFRCPVHIITVLRIPAPR